MVPAVFIKCFTCSFFILVVTQHHVHTTRQNFARYVLGVLTVNLHLHVYNSLTARCWNKVLIICVGDDGCTFGCAITNGKGQVDTCEESFHFTVKRRSTDDDFVELSTESSSHLLLNLLVNLLVYHRHIKQQAHLVVLYLGENAFSDNLLDNQWHSDNYLRLNLGECLRDDGRARNATEIIDMASTTELEDKFESHAVHVGHGQNADDGVACRYMLT